MKIKKAVKASTEPINEALFVETLPAAGAEATAETCKYSAAIDLISAAIESLAEIARDDEIAKDSIANLGVVMLDLKGGCE